MTLADLASSTEDLARDWSSLWSYAVAMVRRLLAALVTAAALAGFVGIHWCMDRLAGFVLHDYPQNLKIITAIFIAGFGVVYAVLVFDMVMIFIPWLRRRQRQGDAKELHE